MIDKILKTKTMTKYFVTICSSANLPETLIEVPASMIPLFGRTQ